MSSSSAMCAVCGCTDLRDGLDVAGRLLAWLFLVDKTAILDAFVDAL